MGFLPMDSEVMQTAHHTLHLCRGLHGLKSEPFLTQLAASRSKPGPKNKHFIGQTWPAASPFTNLLSFLAGQILMLCQNLQHLTQLHNIPGFKTATQKLKLLFSCFYYCLYLMSWDEKVLPHLHRMRIWALLL